MDDEIERAIATLAAVGARYLQDIAPQFEQPASPAEVAEFQAASGEAVPPAVLALLRRTRAITAMDIRNGYWIGGPVELSRSMRRNDFPRSLDSHGRPTRAIPIATDGGGNAFMVTVATGSVWRWDHETGAVACVSQDLPTFLRLVAEDWAHDLDGDVSWDYLV